MRALTPEEQRQAEVGDSVIVKEVTGTGARAAIQSGDILPSVNGERITSAEQLRRFVAKAGKHIAVLVE